MKGTLSLGYCLCFLSEQNCMSFMVISRSSAVWDWNIEQYFLWDGDEWMKGWGDTEGLHYTCNGKIEQNEIRRGQAERRHYTETRTLQTRRHQHRLSPRLTILCSFSVCQPLYVVLCTFACSQIDWFHTGDRSASHRAVWPTAQPKESLISPIFSGFFPSNLQITVRA